MTSTALKLIALFLMFLDHIYEFIGNAPMWLTYLGRLSAPLFLFCMAWGIFYTHDRKKYLFNMYLWGVGMAIGDVVVGLLVPNAKTPPLNDIFVTLFLIGFVVDIIEKYRAGEKKSATKLLLLLIAFQIISTLLVPFAFGTGISTLMVLISAVFPSLLFCEGSVLWVALGVAIYFSRKSKLWLSIVFTLFSVFTLVSMPDSFTYETMFITSPQWMMIGALPLMLCYNGQKGRGYKWLFYIFYPAHIFLLCWLGSFLSF